MFIETLMERDAASGCRANKESLPDSGGFLYSNSKSVSHFT
jgi:hypothetical protein